MQARQINFRTQGGISVFQEPELNREQALSVSPRPLHHPVSEPKLWEGSTAICRLRNQTRDSVPFLLASHRPPPRPSQEAVPRHGCLCCPDPLGPEAEENSYPRRAGTGEETEPTDVRVQKSGQLVAPLGPLACLPKSSLRSASKPGEKRHLGETKTMGSARECFCEHLLFRHLSG